MGRYFLWDPVEDNIVKEIDDAGGTVVDYTTEPNLYGDLISQHRDGESSFYHYDGQGNTTSLSDAVAAVTDTYAYTAFGEVTVSVGNTNNPFQYLGKTLYYRRSITEDLLIRRRRYSPTRARWLSVDPLEHFSERNRYLFVRNAPTALQDPSGMFAMVASEGEEEPVGIGPCADRESWDASMCDECPPCKCGSTKEGTAKISPNFPIAKFWGKHIKETLEIACVVHVKIADCGLPGISWTCAKGVKKNERKLYICISKDLDYCNAKALLYHEYVHAKQFCEQPDGPWGIPLGKCAEYETPAYQAQCNEQSLQACCIADKSKEECKKLIDECVKNGVDNISCNPAIRSTFDPCTTEFPKVFPDS